MSGLALASGSKTAMDEEETATVGGFGQFYKVGLSLPLALSLSSLSLSCVGVSPTPHACWRLLRWQAAVVQSAAR